jgi:hypothetical protein
MPGVIDFIELDLRDYNGNILNGFDQPWFINFSITEYNNDTIRSENLRTYINAQPSVPLNTVEFLGTTSKPLPTTEQPDNLGSLQKQLQESLEKLASNVQKRKSTASIATTISEGTTGAVNTSSNDTTSSSSNAGETEQTTIDANAAKRQRES